MKPPAIKVIPPSPEDDYDRQALASIEKVGWHLVHVQAGEATPAFAFLVGFFRTCGHPEIVVIGLRPETAVAVHTPGAERRGGGVGEGGMR